MCLAVPARIVRVSGEDPLWRTARVDFGGVEREVCLACVPDVREGEYVLVHAGVAISVVDDAEAGRLLTALRALREEGP